VQAIEREQHAAFCKDSLYFIIASTALGSGMVPGAAVSYPLGIISIMNRIVVSPSGASRVLRAVSTLVSPAPNVTSNEAPCNRHIRANFFGADKGLK
jgi:hypothetical protein